MCAAWCINLIKLATLLLCKIFIVTIKSSNEISLDKLSMSRNAIQTDIPQRLFVMNVKMLLYRVSQNKYLGTKKNVCFSIGFGGRYLFTTIYF